jgi:ADP-ribose diphosphatase
MPTKPEILKVSRPDKSRLFHVEQLDLKFSNGAERQFERLVTPSQSAVMVVAVDEQLRMVLIREYAAGLDEYVLTFPKGLIDPGETISEAANRELQEEAGFGAKRLNPIKTMSAAPNYMGHVLDVVIARDLYESKLEGDEPEPLEVVLIPLSEVESLAMNPEFHEGRAIAAMFIARQWLAENS